MATSYTVTGVTGTGPFTLPSDIELLSYARVPLANQIDVVKDGATLVAGTDYTVNESLNQFTLTQGLTSGETLVFNRVTSTEALATFIDGARLTADELNVAYRQSALRLEELSQDLDTLVVSNNPGTLPAVGNAGYILAKVNNTDNSAQWIDFDASSSIVNLQNQITANASDINAVELTIGTESGATSTGIYADIFDAEQLAVDASSGLAAIQTTLYGTDINNPTSGTVLFRVNQAEASVTDKLDKVTTSAQSVASEVTFDGPVSLENEVKASSGRITTDAATRLAVPADLHPEAPTDLINMAQFTQRTGDFLVTSTWDQATNLDDRINYIIPLSDDDVDVFSDGTPDSKYVYPDSSFEANTDFTGYCVPGEGDQPQNGGRYGLYSPGAAFRALESDTDSSRVPGSLAGDVAAYRTDRGIAEATPGSGETFGIEGVRLLNANTFSDSTNAVVGRCGYQDEAGDGTVVTTSDISGRQALAFGWVNSLNRANVLYVPPSDNGGLVKVSIAYTSNANTTDSRLMLTMLTGMDEANESFGPSASAVPVAFLLSDYNSSTNPVHGTRTLEYTYDNSDGKPRYFCASVRRGGNANSTTHGMSVTVSRASDPDFGNFHDVDTANTNVTGGYKWRRGTYDKFVQKQVNDNYVAQ